MQVASICTAKPDDQRQKLRAKEKLIALEKNLQALLASPMEEDTKRLVVAVLLDYKENLIEKLEEHSLKPQQNPSYVADLEPNPIESKLKVRKTRRKKITPINLKDLTLRDFTKGMRRMFVERAVALHSGNIKKTALSLGLSRKTIYNALKGKIQ